MNTNLAQEYANSVADSIQEWCALGCPFGATDEYGNVLDPGDLKTIDNYQEVTAADYLSDVLDIEYRTNARHEYKSAELLVAYGGPNAYIDTGRRTLMAYWGGHSWERKLPADFIDQLDDFCEELHAC